MSRMALLCVLVAMLFLGGCGPVMSLFPLYYKKDVVPQDAILGRWEGTDISSSKDEPSSRKCCWVFKKGDDGAYEVSIPTDKDYRILSAVHFVSLHNALFVDVEPAEVEASKQVPEPFPTITAHLFGTVKFAPDQVTIDLLSNDWCRDAVLAKTIRLSYAYPGQLVLTANTDDLQEFAIKYATDRDAFSDEYTLVRETSSK